MIRGNNCGNNEGTLIYHSGLVQTLRNNEKYWTHLQRDGNLVTRREVSKRWEWATCSGQGQDAKEDFSLVLTASDTLAILSEDGTQIWESSNDATCFAS